MSFCTHPDCKIVILDDPCFSGRVRVEDLGNTNLVKCLNIGSYDVKIPIEKILDIDKDLIKDELTKQQILKDITEHKEWYPDKSAEKEYSKDKIIDRNLLNAIILLEKIFCQDE